MVRSWFLVACLVLISTAPAAGQANGPAADRLVPKWRGQVLAFGRTTSAGVYHSWGGRREVGLNLSGRLSLRDSDDASHYQHWEGGSTEDDEHDTVTDDANDLAIGIWPEIRWWSARERRLSTFWGVTAGTDLSWSDDTYTTFAEAESGASQTETYEHSTHDYGLGCAPLFGASLTITDHFSLLLAIKPVTFSYQWSHGDIVRTLETFDSASDPTPGRYRRTDSGSDSGPLLSWDLRPGLYATLEF